MQINIVIVAYNRAECLKVLIQSLLRQSVVVDGLKLWFYVDHSAEQNVISTLINTELKNKGFNYEIIKREAHLGLKRNTIDAIDTTISKVGEEWIVHLEDDLVLSEYSLSFITQLFKYDKTDWLSIGGVSLYAQFRNPWNLFNMLHSQQDFFYLYQNVSSLGSIISSAIWSSFSKELDENLNYVCKEEMLPQKLLSWNNDTSWKKQWAKYCWHNNLYFIYPKLSFANHIGELGTHVSREQNLTINGPLCQSNFEMPTMNISELEKFDIYGEPLPETFEHLWGKEITDNLEVDLYGMKKVTEKKYILTSKSCFESIYQYGFEHQRPADNVLLRSIGDFFHLALSEDVAWGTRKEIVRFSRFFTAQYRNDNKKQLFYYLLDSLRVLITRKFRL